jgi:hypothetical protein
MKQSNITVMLSPTIDETIKHHGYVIAIAVRAQFFIIL